MTISEWRENPGPVQLQYILQHKQSQNTHYITHTDTQSQGRKTNPIHSGLCFIQDQELKLQFNSKFEPREQAQRWIGIQIWIQGSRIKKLTAVRLKHMTGLLPYCDAFQSEVYFLIII